MSDWPRQATLEALPTLHTISMEALGPDMGSIQSLFLNASSAAWLVANRALLVPFFNLGSRPIEVARMWWLNGATASGNLDCGIYDAAFKRLAATGSTAQAGANVLQGVALALSLPPGGPYYLALAADATTVTLFRVTPGGGDLSAMGCVSMASAFPLPATITPALVTSSALPLFGLSQRGFL